MFHSLSLSSGLKWQIVVNYFKIIVNYVSSAAMPTKKTPQTAAIKTFDVILELYKAKEALVSLAETDQENELIQLINQSINQKIAIIQIK
jgi:hypothetical protein